MKVRRWLAICWHALKAAKSAGCKTWRTERDILAKEDIIRNSEFFDAEWYLTNNPDVATSGMDPAYHYLMYGPKGGRNPSIYFVNDEYYALHNDVRASGMNPLVHFEIYGKKEGREIAFTEVRDPAFPEGCVEGEWRFAKRKALYRRVAVVASYFGDGRISDALIYLLKGIGKVVDNIVYVADCKVFPDEIKKLRSLVTIAKFERHGQYDFGSYRRGVEICRAEGLLNADDVDELVIINDSNYGPIFPFEESFASMASRDCDFWGYTGYNAFGNKHISSYFYLFRRSVIDSLRLDEFLARVQGRLMRDNVIVRFELRLTSWLESHGFTWDTFLPFNLVPGSPMKYPLMAIGKHRVPLLKAKVINGDSYDDQCKVMRLIGHANPELMGLISVKPIRKMHKFVSYAEHQSSFSAKCAVIGENIKCGKQARVIFFITSASMFPAAPLFLAMKADAAFDPKLCVIPDIRWGDGGELKAMEQCEVEIVDQYGDADLIRIRPDEYGAWPEVLDGVDIVVYPSPYELSVFRYNPHYSIGRSFLPVCVNYGYYRSKYDREVMAGQSYAYMWKAFFECEYTASEYKKYSALGGTNIDVVGYIKMDALARVPVKSHARKRVLIALHHSIEGGTNKMLALANFIEYAEYFKDLPDRYPEVDFVFRPHPFLFKIMARTKKWSKQKVSDYIASLRAKPNVIWSDGGDYFREFAESDGCIQDCGSFLVEYVYTGKPCCYMLKSPNDINEKFVQLGKDCLEQCYIAYATADIESFVRNVIVAGFDPKANARKAFAKTVMVNYPCASQVALEHIKKSLIG